MCKIWSIIHDGCRHKDNMTLSICNGRRKCPGSNYDACMHYPCLRIHRAGKCGPCRKLSADKCFDYESKVIGEYFASLSPEELRQHADVDGERTAMLQDVERRKMELIGELPLGNAARGSKVKDWVGKYGQDGRPWGSKRRATWNLSPLANELLPEYIAEPEPDWATIFVQEPCAEAEQSDEGSGDWAADLAKENEYVSDHSVWEIHDYTTSRDGDGSDTSSETSDELNEYIDDEEPSQYKDEEDDDSGFVSEDSMDLDAPDTKEQPQEPTDELASAVEAMNLSADPELAGFDWDAQECGDVYPAPKSLIAFFENTSSRTTSSHDSDEASLDSSADVTPDIAIDQQKTDHQPNYTTEKPAASPQLTTIPETSISACLMEVEGVKYLIGDRPEYAKPWQWSRSACSPKKKKGRSSIIIW